MPVMSVPAAPRDQIHGQVMALKNDYRDGDDGQDGQDVEGRPTGVAFLLGWFFEKRKAHLDLLELLL